jgi:type VI protein secretion system component VasF
LKERYNEDKAKHSDNLEAWRASLIAKLEAGRAQEDHISPAEKGVKNMQAIERRATQLVCHIVFVCVAAG